MVKPSNSDGRVDAESIISPGIAVSRAAWLAAGLALGRREGWAIARGDTTHEPRTLERMSGAIERLQPQGDPRIQKRVAAAQSRQGPAANNDAGAGPPSETQVADPVDA
eukprot:2587371-Pyramimonas_sp.AAC.1